MSTFKANEVLLKDLLDGIEDGQIQLPDFQRGWVWDDARIKDLLVSISRGFPIGAVMTLDAGGDIRFQSRLIEGVSTDSIGRDSRLQQYLLDGQQRLTSLYQALRHQGPVETRDRAGGRKVIERWYYIDIPKALDPLIDHEDAIVSVPRDRIVQSNFGRKQDLNLSSREEEFKHHMIPTESVMDAMRWGFGYADYWLKRGEHPEGAPLNYFERFDDVVLDTFRKYQVPVINLGKETTKEAVCTVFEKVNTGGVTLTVFELMTASFAAESFRLRQDWEQRKARLYRRRSA